MITGASTPEGGASPAEGSAQQAAPVSAEFNSTLPEGLRSNEGFYNFENSEGVYNSYAEQLTTIGDLNNQITELQGKVPVVPAGADGYEVQKPEGYQSSDDLMGEFLKVAHENGLSTNQVNALLKLDHDRMQQSQEQGLAQEVQALDGLQQEWGAAFDSNVDQAKRALEKIGGDEFKDFLNSSRLGNNPMMVKMFYKISQAIAEDSLLTGGTNARPSQGRPTGVDGRPMLKFDM